MWRRREEGKKTFARLPKTDQPKCSAGKRAERQSAIFALQRELRAVNSHSHGAPPYFAYNSQWLSTDKYAGRITTTGSPDSSDPKRIRIRSYTLFTQYIKAYPKRWAFLLLETTFSRANWINQGPRRWLFPGKSEKPLWVRNNRSGVIFR